MGLVPTHFRVSKLILPLTLCACATIVAGDDLDEDSSCPFLPPHPAEAGPNLWEILRSEFAWIMVAIIINIVFLIYFILSACRSNTSKPLEEVVVIPVGGRKS